MTTRPTGLRGQAALRPPLMSRLRAAADGSMIIRTTLLGALAIGVTVGGVATGALVVAPLVGSATATSANPAPIAQSAASSKTSSKTSSTASSTASSAGRSMAALAASVKGQAVRTWGWVDVTTYRLLGQLPEPVARYTLPTIAVVSITGALLALLLPSRTAGTTAPVRVPDRPKRITTPRGIAALTPRSTRTANRKQTPGAVEALAASGASAPDIAWRTGLPLDAVQLLLAISSGPRQLHPPAA